MESITRLLTPKQLADLTGLSVQTLAKLRLTARGPRFKKLGAAVRYNEQDVIEWLNQHPTRRSTSEQPTAA